MTLLACAGYMIATYASIGSLEGDAPWLVALSWVPFLSPYMMLSRLSAGTAAPSEVTLAALLLIATIVLAVRAASRIYSAGVLMYGQKPSRQVCGWRSRRTVEIAREGSRLQPRQPRAGTMR